MLFKFYYIIKQIDIKLNILFNSAALLRFTNKGNKSAACSAHTCTQMNQSQHVSTTTRYILAPRSDNASESLDNKLDIDFQFLVINSVRQLC